MRKYHSTRFFIVTMLILLTILPMTELQMSRAQDSSLRVEKSLGRGAVLPQGFYAVGDEFYILTTTGSGQFNRNTPYNFNFTPFPLENIYRATLRPDGQQVALELFGNEVYVWDWVNAPTLLAKNTKSAPYYSSDGQYIAVATPGFLNIWQVATGERITGYPFGEGNVLTLAFHPTLPRVTFSTDMNQVYHWDFAQDQLLSSGTPSIERIVDIAVGQDNQPWVLGINREQVGVWMWTIGADQTTTLDLDAQTIYSTQFSRDAHVLNIVTNSQIWVGNALSEAMFTLDTETNPLIQAELSATSEHLFIWNPLTSRAEVWELASGTLLWAQDQFISLGQPLALSPDNRHLAVTSPTTILADASVFVWNIDAQTILFTLPHDNAITDLAFSADGGRLATSTRTNFYVWDMATGDLLHIYKISESAFIVSLAFSSGETGLLFNDRTTLGLWQIGATDHEIFTDFGQIRPLNWNDLATWGNWVAVVDGQTIGVYDVSERVILHSFPVTNTPLSLAFSSDGSRLIAILNTVGLVSIDIATGNIQPLGDDIAPSDFAIHATLPLLGIAEVSPATNQQFNRLLIWDMNTDSVRQSTLTRNFVQALQFSPDGQWLVTAENTGLVNFWRVE